VRRGDGRARIARRGGPGPWDPGSRARNRGKGKAASLANRRSVRSVPLNDSLARRCSHRTKWPDGSRVGGWISSVGISTSSSSWVRSSKTPTALSRRGVGPCEIQRSANLTSQLAGLYPSRLALPGSEAAHAWSVPQWRGCGTTLPRRIWLQRIIESPVTAHSSFNGTAASFGRMVSRKCRGSGRSFCRSHSLLAAHTFRS